MIIRFMRHLASHKAVFNLEVDIHDKASLAAVLNDINTNILADVGKTRDFCLQGTERNKLLKLRFTQQDKLLSQCLAKGRIDTPWGQQLKKDADDLKLSLTSKDHACSELVFACAVLQHPDLVQELAGFVDRVTIFSNVHDSQLMSYPDLINVGLMSAVAILLYAPQERDSAIALLNALNKYKNGSYRDRFTVELLFHVYKKLDYKGIFAVLFANHLASFIAYPDNQWSGRVNLLDTQKLEQQPEFLTELEKAFTQWCFDFHFEHPEQYIDAFIRPVITDKEDFARIELMLEPLIASAMEQAETA